MTAARVLTPPGRGAIAVVEVAGPDAVARIDERFSAVNGKPLSQQPIDAVRFGRWRHDDASAGEEVVVVRTADDRVEVHCHGGLAAPRAIVDSLKIPLAEGPEPLEGREPAEGPEPGAQAPGANPEAALPADRAKTPGASAPGSGALRRQAFAALRLAPTERVAGVLLDQMNGAFEAALRAVLEADESNARRLLEGLLRYERLGGHLTTPWRVVLAGPPNVGKSSLINALVGYDHALVYDLPGTTRDVVTAATAIDGWPVTLADTAGVRPTEDTLEAAGVELARRTLATADVVVVVREAAAFDTAEALALRGSLLADAPEGAAIVDVANKVDRLPAGAPPPAGAVATNARDRVGIEPLVEAIGAALGVEPPPAGAAVPFTREQYAAIRRATAAEPAERLALVRALLAGAKP